MAALFGTAINNADLGCVSDTCTYLNNAAPRVSEDITNELCAGNLRFIDASGTELHSVDDTHVADAIAFTCINGVLYVTYYDDDEDERTSFSGVTAMICS